MALVISEEEFQKEASEFLEANASPRVAVNSGWGEGSDEVAILEEKDRAEELEELEAARKWANTRFEAGFGWITGPATLGGRDLPAATSVCTTGSNPLRHSSSDGLRDRARDGRPHDPRPRHRAG